MARHMSCENFQRPEDVNYILISTIGLDYNVIRPPSYEKTIEPFFNKFLSSQVSFSLNSQY